MTPVQCPLLHHPQLCDHSLSSSVQVTVTQGGRQSVTDSGWKQAGCLEPARIVSALHKNFPGLHQLPLCQLVWD